MEFTKALVLAGRGPREAPWSAAPSAPKHLFPIANRPILLHNLAGLRASGVGEAAILVERDGAEALRCAVGDGSDLGLKVRYAEWEPSAGLHGALVASRAFVGDEPVLVQRGDALLREDLCEHIATFERERLDALALRLAAVWSDPPAAARAPGYLLGPRAIEILAAGDHAASGPIADVRAHGGRVRVEQVAGLLACMGGEDALLESNRAMLEGLATSVHPDSLEDSVVQGPVDVHPTARVRRSTLRGPLVIGPDAVIDEAYVGPYTAIGAGVVVEGSQIEHSIVLPQAQLRFVGTRVESSVIGRGARIVRDFRLPGSISLSLGEGAEVRLA
jgi:glucose-1-phosphate thymidylyltransferase